VHKIKFYLGYFVGTFVVLSLSALMIVDMASSAVSTLATPATQVFKAKDEPPTVELPFALLICDEARGVKPLTSDRQDKTYHLMYALDCGR
jgi:hypothetical protein